MDKKRSVLVVGGGPGGYVAAIRAAQLGASVTLVEKEKLGGTCLNVGCIPVKAMLHAAELARAAEEGGRCGIHLQLEEIDWPAVKEFRQGIVNKLTGGVAALLKANGVQVISGTAAFLRPKVMEICGADGTKQLLEADRIILATGSVPIEPPIPGLRESRKQMDSTGAQQMEEIPKSLLIIGGGVIGVEFATILSSFGTEVTIVEALPRLAPLLDGEIEAVLEKKLKAQGIGLCLSHRVTGVADTEKGVEITAEHEGHAVTLQAEKLLCCVGRRARTEGLNTQAAGIRTEQGRILVDDYLETSVPGVYAIGDCLEQVMLSHTAYAQGERAAENAVGERRPYAPAAIPSCVYAFPEAAGVGLTEEEAREKKIPYHMGRFPMSGNGRALISGGGDGLVKVLIGDELNEVLGVHIIGPSATELIAEAALSISMEATAEEVYGTIHTHPSVSEAVREAFLASENRAIHTINKRR